MLKRLICFALISLPLLAQRDAEYDHSVVKQVRIDLRDLGYPPVDVIPPDESATRSLAVAPDGTLYGATSGKRSHLFKLSPVHGYVEPLGVLLDVNAVHRSLVVALNGDVYIGTTPGGHLLRYTPSNDHRETVRGDAPLDVPDLGAPVAGESICALAIDRSRIFGLTSPNGNFFSYDIVTGKFATYGKVAERNMPGEKFENEKAIGRGIAIDADGNAYTSGEGGRLFRLSRSDGTLEKLPVTVPAVPGREPYNRVDAWAVTGSGSVLYGGTSDGYLFRFEPKQMRMQNLGKPLNQYRIRGLVVARNGKLYGVGGDDDEMARLFSYDPANGAYALLGMVDVNRRPYYAWQAYVIDSAALGLEGTVYLGQSERKSKLYLYYPEP
jgi:outer membrane protein assembly factor BamB